MKLSENKSLKAYNTFGIDIVAKRFMVAETLFDLQTIVKNKKNLFLLGGGSNMLLTKNIDKTVVQVATKGKRILSETDNTVLVEVAAGENWHDFVLWAVDNDYGGIENLALIPGNVGTCPIQNIGAYGVEVKDVIKTVNVLDIETATTKTYDNATCEFGYRDSIFKNELKDKCIITSVVFELTKTNHKLNSSYGAIENELRIKNITEPTIADISNAVIAIRSAKLPDPKVLGNSGSFFKNPIIDTAHFEKLEVNFPDMPHYDLGKGKIKVPAGWLIENAGFKGQKYKDGTGVHHKQALVLINHDNASGEAILALARKIQNTIKERFDITLDIEVNIF
jgi:UDP-N-acetylmuramate dehydrogenase